MSDKAFQALGYANTQLLAHVSVHERCTKESDTKGANLARERAVDWAQITVALREMTK